MTCNLSSIYINFSKGNLYMWKCVITAFVLLLRTYNKIYFLALLWSVGPPSSLQWRSPSAGWGSLWSFISYYLMCSHDKWGANRVPAGFHNNSLIMSICENNSFLLSCLTIPGEPLLFPPHCMVVFHGDTTLQSEGWMLQLKQVSLWMCTADEMWWMLSHTYCP